jgi:hypothetical protein
VTSVEILERVTLVTPLAVRFRDAATLSFVTDSLAVCVYPEWAPERRTYGVSNHGSSFVFRNLPGLGDFARGSGDRDFWASWASHPEARLDFVLEVRDACGRYLPYTLPVKLPERRVLGIALASPPASPLALQTGSEEGWLPLFPSPTYAPLDAAGVLRAELADSGSPAAAAWALVEARAGDQRLMTGMADGEGRVMLPIFYPRPVITLGSPGTVNTPLTRQTWPVEFTIRYRRRSLAPEMPDLADVLTQPAAVAWRDSARTTPLTSATLRYGCELVLATEDAGGVPTQTLLITPAGSPP